MFNNIYAGRRVLVTGHTGFKGSWLCLWLQLLGARVFGLGLKPDTQPSHYALTVPELDSQLADIRDYQNVHQALQRFKPEIVFHLAAQSIVRHSYAFPLQTLETNVLGTAHVLEACRQVASVRAVICVSSDKCYEHPAQACRESDPLGGSDPYSASKGCAELVTSAYRRSYFPLSDYCRRHNTLVASARAGNVIGGGDWGQDRLLPDIMRAAAAGQTAKIRNPQAVRPWQHVLEPLSGYLLLGQLLLEGCQDLAQAWNFGPDCCQEVTVHQLSWLLQSHWPEISFASQQQADAPAEATLLRLDSSRARQNLGWTPVWGLEDTVQKTVQWYKSYYHQGLVLSGRQLQEYMQQAQSLNISWAKN